MDITPDTEPLGSEHQAEGLAQRALELAEWARDTASYFDTTDEHGYIIAEAEEEKQIYLQISACLKSYAEIMQADKPKPCKPD